MGCEDSELWITYQQNSRGGKPATTQLIELEFQSHKLNDLEDVLDHVVAQGWIESRYRSIAWWEKHDGTKLKNGERVDTLLNQDIGKCESTSLRLVIADCPSVLWISYVFLKSPNAHTSVQRINITDAADQCGKLERLAHVANFVFRKGYLPSNVRSLVHWEDTSKKRIEEHVAVKDVLCDRGVGKNEDKPLRLVIGLDSAFVAGRIDLEADSGSFKTIPPASVEVHVTIEESMKAGSTAVLPEQKMEFSPWSHTTPSPPYQAVSPTFSQASPSSLPRQTFSSNFSSPSRPSTLIEGAVSLWTLQYILFGILVLLSCTAVLYPRICCCVCEHCRFQ